MGYIHIAHMPIASCIKTKFTKGVHLSNTQTPTISRELNSTASIRFHYPHI